eukprot:GHRQ01021881.1.p1 GENE.GHRQ01021881.1~~GHRQ01021881.1.p1  ORF type:complete len:122 (-),score=37.41 GHRQ01021881.1:646-1011(-)
MLATLPCRFPSTGKFAGEGREVGYNGLYFFGTAHSWVRNVVFENAEFGVAFDGGSFNSVENVTFRSTRPTDAAMPYTGSRGIWNKVKPQSSPLGRQRHSMCASCSTVGVHLCHASCTTHLR